MTVRSRELPLLIVLLLGLLAFIVTQAHGQIQSLQSIPTKPASTPVVTGWRTFAPLRSVDDKRLGTLLSDIESHMPAQHQYRHDDFGSWAHETTHGINSLARNEVGAGYNAFYCLKNRGGVFKEPNMTLAHVAQMVPANMRGDQYELYLVKAQHSPGPGIESWNSNPLYVLDEWVAYINGCYVDQQHCGSAEKSPSGFLIGHNVNSALQFCGYATALLQAIQVYDPNYPDREKLADFVGWNIERTFGLTKLHPEREQVAKLAACYFQGEYCGTGDCRWVGNRWVAQPAQQWRPAQQQVVQPPPRMAPVPPKPQAPIAQTPPAKPCQCDPKSGCKCDPAAACKCDGDQIADLVKRICELEAQRDLLLIEKNNYITKGGLQIELEAALAKLPKPEPEKPCECKDPDVGATRPPAPVYFSIKPRKRK